MPVSATDRHVTVMVNPLVTRLERGSRLTTAYDAEIRKTQHVAELVSRATLLGPIWSCDASLYTAKRFAGPGFLLVGDAGSFIEPLSSFGVKKALASAWLAAVVVHTCLTKPEMREVALEFFTHSYAIGPDGFDGMLEQFQALGADFLEAAANDRHHGFSNVRETLQELHKGVSKAYPCGAGLGLMGVSTDGDVALCHRFAGSDEHKLGTVTDGIDRTVQAAFLDRHHLANKTDCHSCWARPLCSGGCCHEAHTRYGTTEGPNLHYCDWIRGWTETCLRIYGELSVRNPRYLQQFDDQVNHETPRANQSESEAGRAVPAAG